MTATPVLIKQYVQQRDQGYWIENTRISLDSIVYAFLNGESAENIAQNFPLLSLEQVYGAITFYLANQALIEQYLKIGQAEFDQLQQFVRKENSSLYQRLKAAQANKQKMA